MIQAIQDYQDETGIYFDVVEPEGLEEFTTNTAYDIDSGRVYIVSDDTRGKFLETNFDDYSVLEGLLLILLVSVWVYFLFKIVKKGFRFFN